MRPGDVRGTSEYQRDRTEAYAQAEANDTPCELCGGLIDWQAPPRSRWARSFDHVLEVAVHGGQVAQAGPGRVVHVACNSRRGSQLGHRLRQGREQDDPGPSRDW